MVQDTILENTFSFCKLGRERILKINIEFKAEAKNYREQVQNTKHLSGLTKRQSKRLVVWMFKCVCIVDVTRW